jgi:hypothetical protein
MLVLKFTGILVTGLIIETLMNSSLTVTALDQVMPTTTISTNSSTTNTTITTTTTTLPSFKALFGSASVGTTFNSPIVFKQIRSLAIATVDNIQYNLVHDFYVGVYFFDKNWQYVSTFSYPNAFYMIVANNLFYFTMSTGSDGIIATTLTSPAIVYSSCQPLTYRSAVYDQAGSKIIAVNFDGLSVNSFDLTLRLLNSVSLPANPHGVTVFNSKIYVSLWTVAKIVVISNGVITNTYSTQCSYAASLTFDSFGNFMLSCMPNSIVYLYDTNINYLNQYINTNGAPANPLYAATDIKGRLVIAGYTYIYMK